jgi:Dipeptidyl aminopeptidases/acylaminoacyl-peptidases
MKSPRLSLVLVLLSAIGVLAPATHAWSATETASVPRISAEDFGALPFMTAPLLSPSGERVAARAYSKDGLRIAIIDLKNQQNSLTIPIPEDRDLRWYQWAGDKRLLLSVGTSEFFMGEDVYVTRLLMFDIETQQVHLVGKKNAGFMGDDVIYVDPSGSWLLLNLQAAIDQYPSVWRVDLDTLKSKMIVRPQDHVWDWFADSNGVVRTGIGRTKDRTWVLYRRDENSRFERIARSTRSGSGKSSGSGDANDDIDNIVLVAGSDQGYLVSNWKTGRFGLYRYDIAKDEITDTLFEHPSVDLDSVYVTQDGVLRAVRYIDDRQRVEWFDPEMKTIQEEIDAAIPGRINTIVTHSKERDKMIVWTGGASDPGLYYYFEPAAGVMRLLAKPYSRIDAKALAPVESVTYKARDGLEIPAYLTLPRDREPKNLPLVIVPHGGPFARDQWIYHAEVQFLANRGYAVLQPNFRGSVGYGKAFVQKGEGQWGRGMQDDLDDGVKWLVERGTVDPKRVCIMGGSYGGYAAMWAAVRNPDIYRCAISFAGISDVEAMLRYDRRLFTATRYYRDWRSTVQGEKSFDLATVSPLKAADRIQIPLLIAHGARDKTVPVSQSRKMHEALTKANKPHEFVVYKDEGHGFENPDNFVDYLKRVEAFLNEHNPADAPLASTL